MTLKERISRFLGKKGINTADMSEAELGDAVSKMFDGSSFAKSEDHDNLTEVVEAQKESIANLDAEVEGLKSTIDSRISDIKSDYDAKLSKLDSTVANILGQEGGNAQEPEKTPEMVIEELMARVKELENQDSTEGKTTVTAKIKRK